MPKGRSAKSRREWQKVETPMFPRFPDDFGDIQLRDIEAFIAVIRSECSLTKGGKLLKFGKARMNKRMEFLEERLGAPVIANGKLTRTGKRLLQFAEDIYAPARRACNILAKGKTDIPKSIDVGYLETPTALFYSDTLKAFKAKHPLTQIVDTNEWGHELIREIELWNLDVALLVNPHPFEIPRVVRYTELVQYRMFCAVGVNEPHRFAARESVSLKDMLEECILMMPEEASLYTLHVDWLFRTVGKPKHRRHCPNPINQVNRIASGEGVGLVTFPYQQVFGSQPIRLVPIEPAIYLGLGALFRPPVHRVFRDFVEIARSVVGRQFSTLGSNAKRPAKEFVCAIETY